MEGALASAALAFKKLRKRRCFNENSICCNEKDTKHSFLIQQRVEARISGNPKGKARDPWSWSPRREPRALAELEMS